MSYPPVNLVVEDQHEYHDKRLVNGALRTIKKKVLNSKKHGKKKDKEDKDKDKLVVLLVLVQVGLQDIDRIQNHPWIMKDNDKYKDKKRKMGKIRNNLLGSSH